MRDADVNKLGLVLVPHHDGNLSAMLNLDDSETWLLYLSTEGTKRSVRLTGVRDMCVSNFRGGNIISGMWVFDAASAIQESTREHRERLGYGDIYPVRGDFLFVLEGSYGAQVVADCIGVEFGIGWSVLSTFEGSVDGILPTTSTRS